MKFLENLTIPKIIGGIAALIVLCTALGSFYTVDQSDRGVLTRNGKVIGIAQPGLGWKMPFVDDVTKVSTKTATWTWDKMNSYSYDQQPADLKLSVTIHANPEQVDKLYARFGTLDAFVKQRISPVLQQQVKVVFGQYTAVKAIQARGKLNTEVHEALLRSLDGSDLVAVEAVQIESIDFSPTYVQSIEQRMLAEVAVQKAEQDAQQEKIRAQITVTRAQATADSNLAAAKADAEAIKLKGNAEATAIEARAKALGQNPNLVLLTQAEKWDGHLPKTMVPGGATPMLSLK